MKIIVLGSRGFVGRSLYHYLSVEHQVTGITRDVLDVLDPNKVESFLKSNSYDVIINAAATMADTNLVGNATGIADTRNNLGLFMNFHNCRHLFGKFINLGSGAEFDRTRNIDQASPADIFKVLPTDSYGFGQNMKSRVCLETDNFYTIRIFNCFGQGEIVTRLFPKYLKSDNFSISNDRYFDYFSIQDLCLTVEHCINNTWAVKDVNAVYPTKYKISEILGKFCTLNNLEPKFTVDSTSTNNYTGSSNPLNSLAIKLHGLEYGLKNYNVQTT
jgi:nucleoside-diphosphate-sugar epimerase